jgi:act minimal PKS acyl carrier protein
MQRTDFTLEDLKRILREAAGAGVDLDSDILDDTFEDLGYDSLALLETGSRVEREFGITLDDATLAEAHTPAALIEAVSVCLAAAHGA